jgi:SAM-dependent methyltransferase
MNPRQSLQAVFVLMSLWIMACATAQPQPKPPDVAQNYEPAVGQAGKDVVWVPMPDEQLETLLDLARVTATDFLIDLGSGDGRTVIAAARRGARATGVEFNPNLVAHSKREAEKAGVAGLTQFVQGDLFQADLSQATVISLFLLDDINLKLRPGLLKLKPGTRIVSNTFRMGDWEPDGAAPQPTGCYMWCSLYLWIVPATIEGAWRAPEGELKLVQRYQTFGGTLGDGPLAMPVLEGKLNGDRLQFKAGGAEYRGRVSEKEIEGTITTGNGIRPWRAAR